MHHTRGQRRLRSIARASVLGDGLLERLRNTSLALLVLAALPGLAIVALALNQSWPQLAGSPIPVLGSPHQAVGQATVAARASESAAGSVPVPRLAPAVAALPGGLQSGGAGPASSGSAERQPGAQSVVVSESVPAAPVGEGSAPGGAPPAPAPPDQKPVAASPAPAPASPATPASTTTPAAPPGQAPTVSSTPPPPEEAEDSEEEVSEEEDDVAEEDEDEDYGHGRHHGWHHGHGRW